jgi:hypothetical protein
MRHVVLAITTATAMMAAGSVSNGTNAADLGLPPAEVVSPVAVPPPRADVPPEPSQLAAPLEERCPLVWRCGYAGCGWREVCPPSGAEVYPGPNGGYRPFGGYYRP